MSPQITVSELGEKLKSEEKFILLDVREPIELNLSKITDPRLEVVPMSLLARNGIKALSDMARSQQIPVYVLCHHGNRSAQATMWLIKQGYKNIFNVSGGIDAYARKVDPSVGIY